MSTIVLTGGHKGIGLEATRRICETGEFDVILTGRNRHELEEVAKHLDAEYGTKVKTVMLDVASLASVRSGVDRIEDLVQQGLVGPLHAVVLNAGAQFMGPVEYSPDGIEKTFATNSLGHFLMLNLLLGGLQPGGRVIFTASGTHDPDTMDGRMVGRAVDPDPIRLAREGRGGKAVSPGVRYATSKLCVVLYAYELDRRLRAENSSIQSFAFDPGLVVDTDLARTAPSAMRWFARTGPARWLVRKLGVTMGSLSASGGGLAKVAIDPAFAKASGKYIQSKDGRISETRSSATSHDPALARRLWIGSEALGN